MVVLSEKVLIRWSGKNRKYYEGIKNEDGTQKYIFTSYLDWFEVDFSDVRKNSKEKIDLLCDYCKKPIQKQIISYHTQRESSEIKKDCCSNCRGLKLQEKYGTLNDSYVEVTVENKMHTKESLIGEFYRYFNEFGKYPTVKDLKNAEGYPKTTPFNKYWGNYNNFLKDIGIVGEDGWYKVDEDNFKKLYINRDNIAIINNSLLVKRSRYELLNKAKKMSLPMDRELFIKRTYENIDLKELMRNVILDLYNDVGKIPVAMDFDYYLKLNRLPSRRTLEIKSRITYSDFCLEVLSDANQKAKSNEELISELVELRNKLGRTPMSKELVQHGLCETKAYTRRFGMKYSELVKSLGWELSTTVLKIKTKEELLLDFKKLYEELGRIPEASDVDACEYTASSRTYSTHFESIMNILKILNIEICANQEMSAGVVSINKNGEICKSIPELIISNLLIDNNIKYIPELRYSDIDSNLKNKWRMDWFLPDHNICIEYFGMYSQNQLNRNGRLGKYSRKVNKKIDYCKKYNIKLIDIYKEDLNDNYGNLIKKLHELSIFIKS